MDALVNFADFVQFPLKCLKVFGLVPYESGNESSRRKKLLTVYLIFALSNLSLSMTLMVVYVCKNIRDVNLISENLPSFGYAVLAIVKSISIYLKKDEFRDLMDTLADLFPRSKNDQDALNIRQILKSFKTMEKTFSGIICFAGINFIVVPILKLAMTGVWNDKLPLDNWFPFDAYDPRFYTFVFIWEAFNTVVCLASLLGPDLVLY